MATNLNLKRRGALGSECHASKLANKKKYLIWGGGVVLAVVLLLIGGFILLIVRAARVTAKRSKLLDTKIAPALEFLNDETPPNTELILKLAEDPLTRNHLAAALSEHGRSDLFPGEFRELSRIAESDLVRWLSHGNELGSAPSQIELVGEQEVESEGNVGKVFLFRFRVEEPHWASDKGWMAGVSGPFWLADRDQYSGQATFSELETYSGRTDSEHIEFLAQAVTRYGWVMPTPMKR